MSVAVVTPTSTTTATTKPAPTVSRAIPLRSVDYSKLKLLPESAVPKDAVAHLSKRVRTDLEEAANGNNKKKAEEGVWLYDGKAGTSFQFGVGKSLSGDDANSDMFTTFSGAQWWDGSVRKYNTVQNKHETSFAIAEAAAQAAKQSNSNSASSGNGGKAKIPTGKLQVQLSLKGYRTPNSQAYHAHTFFSNVRNIVVNALVNGMTLPDGSVYRWHKEGEVTEMWAKKMFKSPFNAEPATNPKTNEPYDPDVKIKVRYFLKAETSSGGGKVLSLAAPIVDLNTNKVVDDPFTLLTKFAVGKWILTLGNVVKKSDTEINASRVRVLCCQY